MTLLVPHAPALITFILLVLLPVLDAILNASLAKVQPLHNAKHVQKELQFQVPLDPVLIMTPTKNYRTGEQVSL